MSRALQETSTQRTAAVAAPSASPSVATDELDGPLCALSLYLSAAEGASKATRVDRDRLARALQGARAELAALARIVDAACQDGR